MASHAWLSSCAPMPYEALKAQVCLPFLPAMHSQAFCACHLLGYQAQQALQVFCGHHSMRQLPCTSYSLCQGSLLQEHAVCTHNYCTETAQKSTHTLHFDRHQPPPQATHKLSRLSQIASNITASVQSHKPQSQNSWPSNR